LMGSVREAGALPCDAVDVVGVVTFILSGKGSIGHGNGKYQIPKCPPVDGCGGGRISPLTERLDGDGVFIGLVDDGDGSFRWKVRVAAAAIALDEERVAATDGDGRCMDRLAFSSADRQSERGGAVAMAIGGAGGAVADRAGVGDDAVNGMEVFADLGGFGDEDAAALEGGAEFDEDFFLERGSESAEFDFAAEFLDERVAEADASAGVIDTDFARELDARAECFDLGGSGGAAEDEDFASEEGFIHHERHRGHGGGGEIRIKIKIRREFFQNPADGEVLFAAEVDAEVELG
jgi:hypothetical protein